MHVLSARSTSPLGEAQQKLCTTSEVHEERILYFKRYRMECSLQALPAVTVPKGYQWLSWSNNLIEEHAEVLFQSFYQQIDSIVFNSLGNRPGCYSLISDLAAHPGFLPESTWLLLYGDEVCGTVQGLHERADLGAIQNVGLAPAHQGKGLGAALVLKALHGFKEHGLLRGQLEVTARNERAVQLYYRLGFKRKKTIYKSVMRRDCPELQSLVGS